MTPLHHSLLLGPVNFLKLLESEGESFPFLENILFALLPSFLFALYFQGVWGGKSRFSWFSSSAENRGGRFRGCRAAGEGLSPGSKLPAAQPAEVGVWFPEEAKARVAHWSAEAPAAGVGWRAEAEDSAGAGPVFGAPRG